MCIVLYWHCLWLIHLCTMEPLLYLSHAWGVELLCIVDCANITYIGNLVDVKSWNWHYEDVPQDGQ